MDKIPKQGRVRSTAGPPGLNGLGLGFRGLGFRSQAGPSLGASSPAINAAASNAIQECGRPLTTTASFRGSTWAQDS